MTETNEYLLKLISENLSNEEICEKLGISKKQLKRRIESIKYDGYNIDKRYSYNGNFNYIINRDYLANENKISIHDVKDSFRAVVLSDTHLGHSKSDIEYVYKIYEYLIKHDINIAIHCGDLLEGVFQSKLSHEEQIEYFINDYPYAENILTFISFGNHEDEFVKDCGINLNSIIEKERDDIVPLGYGESLIDVNGNDIFISHKKNFSLDYGLKLAGHSHRFKFIAERTGPIVVVPTLSNYLHITDYPGAVDMEIKMDSCKRFDHLSLKHLTINEKGVRETSFIEYPFKRKQEEKVRKR